MRLLALAAETVYEYLTRADGAALDGTNLTNAELEFVVQWRPVVVNAAHDMPVAGFQGMIWMAVIDVPTLIPLRVMQM